MNDVERMAGQLAALCRRVVQLETASQQRMAATPDQLAAQRAAQEIGFSVDVIVLVNRGRERRQLARALRKQYHWSAARIARALNCCERTAERWLA